MPKVKSEIMNDENFVKMFVNKYGQEPKNLFNDFGENFNSLEFYLENGQLKLSNHDGEVFKFGKNSSPLNADIIITNKKKWRLM